MSSSPILDNLRNVSLEVPTQWTPWMNILCNSSEKLVLRKEPEPDNKVRLDLGDEERKKKLEEVTAEFDPLTRLMNDLFWRQGLQGDVCEQ